MILDLTTMLTADHPMIAWAKTKENPHIAMGHVGTHLDTYEKTKIPLEYFRSRGVLFQVVGIAEVTEDDIDLTKVQEGDFVLFRTGRSEEYAGKEDSFYWCGLPRHSGA